MAIQRRACLVASIVTLGALAAAGCRGPAFNDCGPVPGAIPAALRAKFAPPVDEGPHPIQPPHSRFHPVPTHPVFATQAQHLEELPPAGNGVKLPNGNGSSRPINRKPAQPVRAPDSRPLEKPPVEETRPDIEAPRIPPQSGSSGVTLNGPHLQTMPDSQINTSPYGGWRGRRVLR